MQRLPNEVKEFIVREVACYSSPSQVAELVQQTFGYTVSRQQVECYHPYRLAGARVSIRWQRIFQIARDEFERQSAAFGLSHKAVRLRQLQMIYEDADASGNLALALKVLRLAMIESP